MYIYYIYIYIYISIHIYRSISIFISHVSTSVALFPSAQPHGARASLGASLSSHDALPAPRVPTSVALSPNTNISTRPLACLASTPYALSSINTRGPS